MTGTAGVGLLAASLALGIVVGAAVVSTLEVRGRPERLLAGATVLAAEVVLLFEALSLIEQLRPAPFLVGQVLLAVGALLLLLVVGGPSRVSSWWAAPVGLLREMASALTLLPSSLRRLSPQARAVAALATVVGASVLLELVLALAVAPNNFDSMTYHLSRAAYWLQFHTIEQFPEATARQGTFPPNAEILSAWTMMLTKGDRFAQLVQWAAMLGTAGSVYCWARMLAWGRQAALFAALVFAMVPLVVLQASSTQNDLVVTAFLIAGALFLYRGITDQQRGELVVGAVAVALAVGTKTTALFMLPGIALLALAASRWRLRPLVVPTALVLCGVVLLGSFSYVDNLSHGYLFGSVDTELRTRSAGEAIDNLVDVTGMLRDTGGYQTGWLDEITARPSATVSEDLSAYGPIGIVVVLPLVLWFSLPRRAPADGRWLAVAALSYLVLFGLVYKQNVFVARLLMPFIAFGAPFVAALWRREVLAGAVCLLAVVAAVPALVSNVNKPIVTPAGVPSIFDRSRESQQTVVNGDVYVALDKMRPLLARAERVAVAGGEDTWDYPYFGKHLDREVRRVDAQTVSRAMFEERDVPLLVWADLGPPPPMPGVRAQRMSQVIWALTKR